MSDVISERLAEIRENYVQYERFKAADDGSVASFINTVGSAAYTAFDGVPPLLAAVDAALRFHEPVETANGVKVCPRCSRAAGSAVRSPCEEMRAVAAALSQDVEETR